MQVLPWPPPPPASGNCCGVRDGVVTPVLHQFHYVDERGSQWGFVVESYRTHGRQVEDTGHFDGWVWLGPGGIEPALGFEVRIDLSRDAVVEGE